MKGSPQFVPYYSTTCRRKTGFILFIENSVLIVVLKMPYHAKFLVDLKSYSKIICYLFTVKAVKFSP